MRHLIVFSTLLLAVACGWLPAPDLPQIDQAAQAIHGGGERYRAHQRCLAASTTVAQMLACMQAEGYAFIPRHTEYPSPTCWDARDADARPQDLLPQCFEHAADTPH